ncbi:LuxR C-terminal-related transcriptional regulator [Devosia sp.]|uniref:LuxR C-terminal-related transcriptional regulator n=1 Tax=Devosia sp. TaxID=1871048 RepID=UPI003265D41C
MAGPLVATKLFIPKLRSGLVERPRLREHLKRGAEAKLTLISAPAGFGKTTLLTEWLAEASSETQATAWLALDKGDNDPGTFWSYLITALQTAVPSVGAGPLSILKAGQPPTELVLAGMVNELSALSGGLNLVLDDYHLIEHQDVHTGMAFLVEHIPAHVHIVISTRVDPPFPLARLRARNELVEVRSADLRFTGNETARYFNGAMHLGLSAKDVIVLEARTEGWVAALQLAALSMQGRHDLSAFVKGFAGNDRFIFDYLVEEVLQRQSEEVRSFLLSTCFLERLSGPLCDAVTGSNGGKAMLEALDRQNLFMVPLDDRRQWYRYHHLFADVLRSHIGDEGRRDLPTLHRRASDWYEQCGERIEAIQHALAGNDLERAAGLIERALPDMQRNRQEATIRRWAHLLPHELVSTRPVLGIGLVGGLVSFGEFAGIEDRLRDIERCLVALSEDGKTTSAHGVIVIDQVQLPRVAGAVELYRAALAQVRGDLPSLIHHAQKVLEVAPVDDHLARAAGSSMLGIALWSAGDLEAAYSAWLEGKNGLQRAGHIADMLGVSIALADILLALGQLRQAEQTYQQALQLVATSSGAVLRGTADIHAGLSALYRERNDFKAAHDHLSRSQDLGEQAGLPQHPYRLRVASAHLLRDKGDLVDAAALMGEAVRLYVSDFFPHVRPVAAMQARISILQGRLDEAQRWQLEAEIAADDELSYLHEFEHITLARLLLAQHNGEDQAVQLLERLGQQALRGKRTGSLIEILLLQALAYGSVADIPAALVVLERALTLAEPEGYVRVFLEGGERMATLLKLALKRGVTPVYTRSLLAGFGPVEAKPPAQPGLIEPLSDRELDVLRLLRSDLGGPEIARELMISLNTMRTHTKNIFEKLGVNSRRSAVHRADELICSSAVSSDKSSSPRIGTRLHKTHFFVWLTRCGEAPSPH